jgi:hypothetical protein
MVRRVGGVIGPFVAEDRVSTQWDSTASGGTPPVYNDCAGSSKSFAYSFHFAASRLGAGRVGMATDFSFIPGTMPRFGDNGCWAYHLAENPNRERQQHAGRYLVAAQRDGIVYDGLLVRPSVVAGFNIPLKPYRMGDRAFDFNVDGLSHFGLIPDMLQDLANLGMPLEDRKALWTSAEGYIEMWEKALRAAHQSTANSQRR